jgi:hypothetical protein
VAFQWRRGNVIFSSLEFWSLFAMRFLCWLNMSLWVVKWLMGF